MLRHVRNQHLSISLGLRRDRERHQKHDCKSPSWGRPIPLLFAFALYQWCHQYFAHSRILHRSLIPCISLYPQVQFPTRHHCNNNSCCFISRDYCWDTSATPPGPKYTQTVSSNPPEPVCPNELPTCSYIFGGGVVPNYLTYLYTTDCISPCANPPTSIILKDTLIPRISKTY